MIDPRWLEDGMRKGKVIISRALRVKMYSLVRSLAGGFVGLLAIILMFWAGTIFLFFWFEKKGSTL
jgi:hypothetical protein